MTPEIEQRLAALPPKAGVYIFRGKRNEVLYVGKATNLRNRVRSYFNGHDPRPFVALLDQQLGDIETILTQNAKDALLLENTLIKKHRPRYNVMLRDDKNYLSIRIDETQRWPRVELTRRIRDDGARYFGPYHSAQAVRRMLNVLNRHFHLRTCRDSVFNNRVRPCLQYQIKRCPGPCVLPVDRAAYFDDLRRAGLFLQGREDELLRDVEVRMFQSADELDFERAARYRDQLAAIRDALQPQGAIQTSHVERDVLGLHRDGEYVVIAVSTFRSGALLDVISFELTHQLTTDDEVLAGFISQYYSDQRRPPEEILCSVAPAEPEDLEVFLGELRGRKATLLVPQRGDKVKLVELAVENARLHFENNLSTEARASEAVERLQARLGLRSVPRTIECYDISNFQGREIVASQVCFVDGRPDREAYRRYRIKLLPTQDDFASMYQVILRRARRAQKGDRPMPDLILIDGGKGQLNAACAALMDAGARDQDIVSIAKSRLKGATDDDGPVRSDERIFVPGRKDPVVLKQTSEEMHLLERLRDEAHKTAITYHRELRSQNRLTTELDAIAGVGPVRRKALLRHFGSVKKVRSASLAEIAAAPGIDRLTAWRVFDAFHPGQADRPDE